MVELEKRRTPEVEGVPVVLGDGQAWTLARPVFGGFHFVRPPGGGKTALRRSVTSPEGYDALLDAFFDSSDGAEEAVALADLAFALLSVNYDLTFDDCRTLLRRDFGDEANGEMWAQIADVAVGRSPKVSPVGSGPA